jgi:hypothetical protein
MLRKANLVKNTRHGADLRFYLQKMLQGNTNQTITTLHTTTII